MASRSAQPRREAAGMAARCLTALIGSYCATAAVATLVARLAPIARVEATAWAMIPSFLFYAAIGLWCFHEPRLSRVVPVVWGIALIGGGGAWLLGIRP